MTRRLERDTVAAFACVVALLVLFSAYFSANRPAYMDELGLYNPSYMVGHYGKLTYPIYNYESQPVIVHPPIHVGVIGLLCRLGFTWYYAEGTPTAFFLLLAIWIVVRGAFPTPVKLALLFGVGFLMAAGNPAVSWFGTRPEGELHAAWFAALLMLESGRLSNWNGRRLFAGAFLLAWASSVHYYATPAVLGLAVYPIWMVSTIGWKAARPRVLAIVAGAALFGAPYLALYIGPNWHSIVAVIRQTQGGAHASPIRQHLDLYRQWADWPALPILLRRTLALGVPLMVFSTVLLAVVRSTRGMAIASLPLQLGIFFFAAHKQPAYLIHELSLFAAALAVGLLALVYWMARRSPLPAWSGGIAMSLAATGLCLNLVTGFASQGATTISTRPQIHPGDLARAACKQILGPHARVVSRMGAWYTAGAEHWHADFQDLIGPESSSFDPASYLANFDAAADYAHYSGNDGNNTEHKTLSQWYATGLLTLRGFYFAREGGDVSLVLTSVNKPPKVAGYASVGRALYRFDESLSGGHDVITATCPHLPELEDRFQVLYPRSAIAVLDLPASNPHPPGVIVTVLTPRASSEPAGLLGRACTEVGSVRGVVSPADADALIASLRREDTPIRFYSNVEDVPGFQGAGIPADAVPPTGAVPLDGVVNLRELDPAGRTSRIERLPQVRVTAHSPPGAFAANLPLHAAGKIEFPYWVKLRLRVLSGRVGLAATTRGGGIVARSGLLLPSPEPVEVALKLSNPSLADDITFFNGNGGGFQTEILEAAAVASPQDALVFRRLIATEGAPDALSVPSGLQPPAGAFRLDTVLNLPEAQPGYKTARLQWLPQLRVTTPDVPGGFGVSFPLHFAGKIATPVRVWLRLRVLSGRVGLALTGKGAIVTRSSRCLLPTTEPVTAALQAPELSRADTFVVFNESVASASQVEILDIAVAIPQQEMARYREIFPMQPLVPVK